MLNSDQIWYGFGTCYYLSYASGHIYTRNLNLLLQIKRMFWEHKLLDLWNYVLVVFVCVCFLKDPFKVVLSPYTYDSVSFKLSIIVINIELCCLVPVSQTLTFIQGHWGMRKPKLLDLSFRTCQQLKQSCDVFLGCVNHWISCPVCFIFQR